jgi:hypothetical protein
VTATSVAAPLRLTERARTLLALLLLTAAAIGCVFAYTTGERWRCERLRAAHNPAATAYCPAAR